MTEAQPNRRRVLQLMACTAASAATPVRAESLRYEWGGTALGADVRILLEGLDPAAAGEAVQACIAEIERQERIFSLHRPSSELCRLNAGGMLEMPSLDLASLLRTSHALHRATEGLFDPTIQPLWRLYAQWYGSGAARAPLPSSVSERLALVGMRRVAVEPGIIRLAPRTELTLNGIAQGYITDRVADVLTRRGLSHMLIDIGEVRALGGRMDGSPFQIAIRDSGLRLPLVTAALATSSSSALFFSQQHGAAHILHPTSGHSDSLWRSVTVQHASAAVADGLSTALALADRAGIVRVLSRIPGARAWVSRHDGTIETFG